MSSTQHRVGRSSSALAGLGVGVVSWRAIAPWDLSTYHNSRRIDGALSEAQQVTRLFIALAVPYVLAMIGAALRWIQPLAFSAASGAVWIVLTTWRGAVAEVSGANMAALWPVVGVPLTMVGSGMVLLVVFLVDRLRGRPNEPSLARPLGPD